MPPAARAGDLTSHGSPLAPGIGSLNVMIGGQPAWRATADTSTCPLSDGPKPHVGGVVLKGSTKVFINNLPAVRQGDSVVEAGAPNTISQGYPKVDLGG